MFSKYCYYFYSSASFFIFLLHSVFVRIYTLMVHMLIFCYQNYELLIKRIVVCSTVICIYFKWLWAVLLLLYVMYYNFALCIFVSFIFCSHSNSCRPVDHFTECILFGFISAYLYQIKYFILNINVILFALVEHRYSCDAKCVRKP